MDSVWGKNGTRFLFIRSIPSFYSTQRWPYYIQSTVSSCKVWVSGNDGQSNWMKKSSVLYSFLIQGFSKLRSVFNAKIPEGKGDFVILCVKVSLAWEQCCPGNRESGLFLDTYQICMLDLPNVLIRGLVKLFSFSDVPFFFLPEQVIYSPWSETRNPSWRSLFLFILKIQSQQFWPSVPQAAFFHKEIVFLWANDSASGKNGLKCKFFRSLFSLIVLKILVWVES